MTTTSQAHADLRKYAEERFDNWAQDTLQSYSIANVPFTEAYADVVGIIAMNLIWVTAELRIDPLVFCEFMHKQLTEAAARRKRKETKA